MVSLLFIDPITFFKQEGSNNEWKLQLTFFFIPFSLFVSLFADSDCGSVSLESDSVSCYESVKNNYHIDWQQVLMVSQLGTWNY